MEELLRLYRPVVTNTMTGNAVVDTSEMFANKSDKRKGHYPSIFVRTSNRSRGFRTQQ